MYNTYIYIYIYIYIYGAPPAPSLQGPLMACERARARKSPGSFQDALE